MEQRLNDILNAFETNLVASFKGERSDYNLKNDYIDLKYDFMKLLLEATHKEPSKFSFDLFQEKVKKTSPLMKDNFRKDDPQIHLFSRND
tara:strand:- start:32 stop:301 length:270 start_codon:yes stop_codon:yes gene_type:complete